MLWYELSGRLDGTAGLAGKPSNLAFKPAASAGISGQEAVRMRVTGAVGATAGIAGDAHPNKLRINAQEVDAAASVSGQPLRWVAPANFPNVRSQGVAPIPDAIGTHAAALTPNDVTTFTPTRWLWIGGTGDVAVTMNDGSQFVFAAVPAGTRLPISVTQLLGNTTATNVVGVY